MPQLEAGHFSPKHDHVKRRTKTPLSALCTCLFFPWALFAVLYAAVTFKVHYSMPLLCMLIVVAGMLLSLAIGAAALQKLNESKPSWLLFLFATTVLATVSGTLLGDINFWTNMQSFYDLETLNVYTKVDPAKAHGQQMMDAGMARFVEGSGLDLGKAVRFQDLDAYCAAPIVNGTALSGSDKSLESYDFWAVGLNCCPRNTSKQVEFKCGQYKSTTAREGLRLMDENQRDYFRLAVQQAEAEFRIHAKHPIFFYWTEDAATDMNSYWEYGYTYFKVGVASFLVVQIFLILLASVLASKYEF